MFKKMLLSALLLLSAVGFAQDKYEVVLLGDLHYDSADIRVAPGKLSANRKREFDRNVHAWAKNIPELLKRVAQYAGKDDVLFTVQCGDITQGDEGKYELACAGFQRVLKRYMGKLNYCVHYKNVSGFNVLRIDGDRVFVDIYCGKLDKPFYTQKIN